MIRETRPNRIVATKSFPKSEFSFPVKFCVEPKKDEWFLFGFEPNNFVGNQLIEIFVKNDGETVFEVGYKKTVNFFDIHNPTENLKNIKIIKSVATKNEDKISVEWEKNDLFNEYCIFVRATNRENHNLIVTIEDLVWKNKD